MGRVYGIDILNELVKMRNLLKEPKLSYEIMDRHDARMAVDNLKLGVLQEARAFEISKLESQIGSTSNNNRETEHRLMFLNTENKEHRRIMRTEQPILMTDTERIKFSQEWFHYSSRKEELEKNRIKVFYLILGQCSERLIKRMRKETEWALVHMSFELHNLTELVESCIYWEHKERTDAMIR